MTATMFYKHTQIGSTILWVLLAVTLLMIFIWSIDRQSGAIAGFTVLGLLIVALVFGTLTVEVDSQYLRCWFGPGWIRKEFAIAQITNAIAVRNHWWYGWGIRYTPRGWMFNVSGLDAVEITFTSGQHFRIGTDEPEALVAAIRDRIA
ncbi:hypothetical protein JJD41_17510 [Oxynema sp. CENA135]|uniref:hypothetical protein n=1 Tax=Oxynema sp. CENA135 TaxID=984206 RepID=UPI00190C9949|nr:hypothetical protein [Oxynema sp. CENA135]MBK4731650.1 hypothetical protein [Oxynema sp. CENA135]